MNHFEFKVGDTSIRVHQAFRRGETAKVTVIDGKTKKMTTLIVKPIWEKEQIEIEFLNEDVFRVLTR